MNLPFSPLEFLDVFGRYNDAVWPLQFAFTGLGLAATALAAAGKPWSDRAVAAILAFLWGWMGLVYHLLFFAQLTRAALLFGTAFLVQALLLGTQRLHFGIEKDARSVVGGVLVAFGLAVYPALSLLLGNYPEVPTFGLPCPTTIFTIGMLAFLQSPYPRNVLIIPVLWAGVGTVAAEALGMVQDFALLAAAGVALWLFIRRIPPKAYA